MCALNTMRMPISLVLCSGHVSGQAKQTKARNKNGKGYKQSGKLADKYFQFKFGGVVVVGKGVGEGVGWVIFVKNGCKRCDGIPGFLHSPITGTSLPAAALLRMIKIVGSVGSAMATALLHL